MIHKIHIVLIIILCCAMIIPKSAQLNTNIFITDCCLKDRNILIMIPRRRIRTDKIIANVSNQEDKCTLTTRQDIFSRNATTHHAKNKFEMQRSILSFIGEKKLYQRGIRINIIVITLKNMRLKCQKTNQKIVKNIEIFKKRFSFLSFRFF